MMKRKSDSDVWEDALDEISEHPDDQALFQKHANYFAELAREKYNQSVYKNRKNYSLGITTTGAFIDDRTKELYYPKWREYYFEQTGKPILDFRVQDAARYGLFRAVVVRLNVRDVHERNSLFIDTKNLKLLLEISRILILKYNLDLRLADLIRWIKLDDYFIQEILATADITPDLYPAFIYPSLRKIIDESFDIGDLMKSKADIQSSAIRYFWDWMDQRDDYINSYNLDKKLGIGLFDSKIPDDRKYEKVLRAFEEEVSSDIRFGSRAGFRAVVKDYKDHMIGFPEIPRVSIKLENGLTDIYDTHLIEDKPLHSWYNILMNTRDEDFSITRWLHAIYKRYLDLAPHKMALLSAKSNPKTPEFEKMCNDPNTREHLLEIRDKLNSIGNYCRASDYEPEITREPSIPIAVPLISKVFNRLIYIQKRLLADFTLDLSIYELICVICGMYFEMDWVTTVSEAMEFLFRDGFVINFNDPKVDTRTTGRQVYVTKQLLQIYYNNFMVAANPLFERMLHQFVNRKGHHLSRSIMSELNEHLIYRYKFKIAGIPLKCETALFLQTATFIEKSVKSSRNKKAESVKVVQPGYEGTPGDRYTVVFRVPETRERLAPKKIKKKIKKSTSKMMYVRDALYPPKRDLPDVAKLPHGEPNRIVEAIQECYLDNECGMSIYNLLHPTYQSILHDIDWVGNNEFGSLSEDDDVLFEKYLKKEKRKCRK